MVELIDIECLFFIFRLKLLEEELNETVSIKGAWVEHKDLLVAWHYRCAWI